jgi:hypothetical protein
MKMCEEIIPDFARLQEKCVDCHNKQFFFRFYIVMGKGDLIAETFLDEGGFFFSERNNF